MKLKILKFIHIFLLFCLIFSNITIFASSLSNDKLYCTNNLIMDFESGNVLFEKNGYEKVYPASTTKILTAILALENLDINNSIVVSNNAIDSTPIGSSVMKLQKEEVISIKNVLYGLLLVSGNDAANVIAESVSGNIDDFINLMNEKLKEIGCYSTHFTNAHGFHDDNHYSTAYDMALIMKYAMQNETFRQIIETKEYIVPETNKYETRNLENTNRMFDETKPVYYEYILGGKTGYTEEARGTFVGYGKKDNKLVITCSFNGSQNIDGNAARFLDTKTLFEYAFKSFNRYKILDISDFNFVIYDENHNMEYILKIDDDKYALYDDSGFNISYIIDANINDIYNLNLNEKAGILNYKVSGETINIENSCDLILIEKNTCYRNKVLDFIYELFNKI